MTVKKQYFHHLFRNTFCHHFQRHVFEKTFVKTFDEEELITEKEPIGYEIAQPINMDMYVILIKMCNKYDCSFYTDDKVLYFAPAFSAIKNTHWEQMIG